MPTLEVLFARFGLALFLGFLIGLERERDKQLVFAGMRTFALISLLGATLAFASEQFAGPWLFIVGFATVSAFSLLAHFQGFETGHIGITTEVVFMLSYVLGAMIYWDMLTLAGAITVIVVLVLSFKPNLQSFLMHIDREDILAGLEFAIVWVIVLPILPDQTYGPFDVLNPREIWLMVVFVAGINLASYVLSQVYGAQRGIGITGILGGMISSTAVTFEFAHRSRKEEERHNALLFTLAISVASTGMFFRIVALTMVINPALGLALTGSMLVGAVISAAGALVIWQRVRRTQETLTKTPGAETRSPFALRPAIQFGVIFAIVLLASKAAEVYLGSAGAYLSGIVGGVAGMDAVTLSMAKLAGTAIPQVTAVRSVALGAAANMLFKGVIAALLGRDAVRYRILPLFALTAVATALTAFLLA